MKSAVLASALLALLTSACSDSAKPATDVSAPAVVRPSILLVTLDTTRADAVGPGASGIDTKNFNALAARGRRFSRAYATVPETLPSHSSMMTGLYPAGHGVHENARNLSAERPLLAERLRQSGYQTAAFVSSFVLARRFGLGRGFETYDDVENAERSARETTDRAIGYLRAKSDKPQLLWVHYFDAHAPYAPPEPYRTRFAKNLYLGEVAAVDEQLGRLVAAFEQRARGPFGIVVVGDHGEGLGDHGERQHGNLVYESTMHVPLLLIGPGIPAAVSDTPVSTRRIFNTILDLAGLDSTNTLRSLTSSEVVLGEAMKPFLEYGWQPQIMAVDATHKAIVAGAQTEVYDVVADPAETHDLAAAASLSRSLRNAMKDYPIPSPSAVASSSSLSDADRKKLASLGYVSAGAIPVVRKDAPRPVDMAQLFEVIEKASGLFVNEQYTSAIPMLKELLARDPHNLDAALRLASSYSALGQETQALAMFEKAKEMAPLSPDVKVYLALHLARGPRFEEAAPMLEKIFAETPDRLPALEALARVRERQHRTQDALAMWTHIHSLRKPSPVELLTVGRMAMEIEDTPAAIQAFEGARAALGSEFRQNLELGVLYLEARRFEDARDALDRVSPQHPAFSMALFKRAQVSVLLHEPDSANRIDAARRRADSTTRGLIASERLFQVHPQ